MLLEQLVSQSLIIKDMYRLLALFKIWTSFNVLIKKNSY